LGRSRMEVHVSELGRSSMDVHVSELGRSSMGIQLRSQFYTSDELLRLRQQKIHLMRKQLCRQKM
jgi:hypothetical protein